MEKMTRNSEALELDVAIRLLFFLVSTRFCFDTDVGYINISLVVILNAIMYQSNRSLNIPRANPQAFEFLENFCSNPPHWAAKLFKCPIPGKLPDYCFNIFVASIMLLKLCMLTWFIRQHVFIYYRYNVPVKWKLEYPPWATPLAFEFLEIFFLQIPPHLAEKLFNFQPRENYQITVLTFP